MSLCRLWITFRCGFIQVYCIPSTLKEPCLRGKCVLLFAHSLAGRFRVIHAVVSPSILINNNRTRIHHEQCKTDSIRHSDCAVFFESNRTYAGGTKTEFSFFRSILYSSLSLVYPLLLSLALSHTLENTRHSSPVLHAFPSVLLA